MAIRGEDPLRIKCRAEHLCFTTMEAYIREDEQVRDGFGTVFPPLPVSLLGEAGDVSPEPPTTRSGSEPALPEGAQPGPGMHPTASVSVFEVCRRSLRHYCRSLNRQTNRQRPGHTPSLEAKTRQIRLIFSYPRRESDARPLV
jgi:hypothetical protein